MAKSNRRDESHVTIAQFNDAPQQGAVTFATLGWSNFLLAGSTKLVREELALACRAKFAEWNQVAILRQLAAISISRTKAFVRGQVFRARGTMFPDGSMEAMYFSSPALFPSCFSSCDAGFPERVAICWAIPISRPEADFVQRHGWDKFEEMLDLHDPDLLDFQRRGIV